MKTLRPTARRNRKRAQGMTEYIIIVGLIAILMVGATEEELTPLLSRFDDVAIEDAIEGVWVATSDEPRARGAKG